MDASFLSPVTYECSKVNTLITYTLPFSSHQTHHHMREWPPSLSLPPSVSLFLPLPADEAHSFTCKRTVITQPLFNTKAARREKFQTNGHFVFATLNIVFFVPRLDSRRFLEASEDNGGRVSDSFLIQVAKK